MTQIPISGAYVKILYEFEDSYGIPKGGSISKEGITNITKILGHGVRVNNWSKDNGLRAIVGLNNVEPSAVIDGPFNGTISVEFDTTADISWLKGVMGYEETRSTTVKAYTKYIAPPSMSFLIYVTNDSVDPKKGDAFLLTGVIISEASFSIESGDNPVHVSLNCSYQTEYKFDNLDNIPIINSPLEQPFNYSMVNAYFWNPSTDINDVSSFDSIECTVDRLNFTIRHPATQIRGIGTRIPKDKVHANIEYELSMNSVFKDPKKFLERFYGCYNTPSKYIAPYEQVKIVIENFFRDSRHAKLQFAFKHVKIRTHGLPLAIENVIMEDMSMLPISCDITVERGCPAEPLVAVSPSIVETGKQLYISGANFYPGETVTAASTLFPANIEITANCLGEIGHIVTIPSDQTAGAYSIDITSESTLASTLTFEVIVIGPDDLLPKMTMCKSVLGMASESIALTGYNFTGTGAVDLALEKYDEGLSSWIDLSSTWGSEVAEPLVVDGTFSYVNTGSLITVGSNPGKYRIKATRGALESTALFYVPEITTATLSVNKKTLTVNGKYYPPMTNVTLIYRDGTTDILIGIHAVSSAGYLPGPTTSETLTYVRTVDFPHDSPVIRVTIPDVNGSSFTLQKNVTELA